MIYIEVHMYIAFLLIMHFCIFAFYALYITRYAYCVKLQYTHQHTSELQGKLRSSVEFCFIISVYF